MERKIIWKLNIIDILIIAAIVISCTLLIYKFIFDNRKSTEFRFTYTCEDIRYSMLSEISAGEQLIDSETGKPIGTVTDFASNDKNSGAVIYATAYGFDEKNGVSVSDSVYLKGQNKRIIIGDCILDVYIMDIEKE